MDILSAGLWQTVLPGSSDLVATSLQHAALYKMSLGKTLGWVWHFQRNFRWENQSFRRGTWGILDWHLLDPANHGPMEFRSVAYPWNIHGMLDLDTNSGALGSISQISRASIAGYSNFSFED